MHVLVVGSTGATGRLLLETLLDRKATVTAVARQKSSLPEKLRSKTRLRVVEGSLLDFTDAEMAKLTTDIDAIASCLGHNMSFKGIYGKPRRLVTDATRRLCTAAMLSGPDKQTKFVLMNTTGNRNRDLNESLSVGHRIVVGLLRLLLPPQPDNEQAAEHLRSAIGQDHRSLAWAVVRPDGLINEEMVSEYSIHPSPTRDPIFNAGKTSRSNVAHFMADLIMNQELWNTWKGQMPVIYNRES